MFLQIYLQHYYNERSNRSVWLFPRKFEFKTRLWTAKKTHTLNRYEFLLYFFLKELEFLMICVWIENYFAVWKTKMTQSRLLHPSLWECWFKRKMLRCETTKLLFHFNTCYFFWPTLLMKTVSKGSNIV